MKKVLIVDDAKFMRMMIRNILEKCGKDIYEVVGEAENGFEALDQYKKLAPDIVTMDITMPECDGIQGVRLIRDYDSNAKIIMVSAMGQQAMVMDAIQVGAKDFIVKPFNQDRIMESLANLK